METMSSNYAIYLNIGNINTLQVNFCTAADIQRRPTETDHDNPDCKHCPELF
jgi:hypothetical protein